MESKPFLILHLPQSSELACDQAFIEAADLAVTDGRPKAITFESGRTFQLIPVISRSAARAGSPVAAPLSSAATSPSAARVTDQVASPLGPLTDASASAPVGDRMSSSPASRAPVSAGAAEPPPVAALVRSPAAPRAPSRATSPSFRLTGDTADAPGRGQRSTQSTDLSDWVSVYDQTFRVFLKNPPAKWQDVPARMGSQSGTLCACRLISETGQAEGEYGCFWRPDEETVNQEIVLYGTEVFTRNDPRVTGLHVKIENAKWKAPTTRRRNLRHNFVFQVGRTYRDRFERTVHALRDMHELAQDEKFCPEDEREEQE